MGTTDAKRRRKMLWFLVVFAGLALIASTLRAISMRMTPGQPLHPRQPTPESRPFGQ